MSNPGIKQWEQCFHVAKTLNLTILNYEVHQFETSALFHAKLSSLKQAAVPNDIGYQVLTEDFIFGFLAITREPAWIVGWWLQELAEVQWWRLIMTCAPRLNWLLWNGQIIARTLAVDYSTGVQSAFWMNGGDDMGNTHNNNNRCRSWRKRKIWGRWLNL